MRANAAAGQHRATQLFAGPDLGARPVDASRRGRGDAWGATAGPRGAFGQRFRQEPNPPQEGTLRRTLA
jgi:hypothetical protein